MKWVLIAVGLVVALVVLAVLALFVNLALASRRQERKLRERLGEVGNALDAGRTPDAAAVRRLAAQPDLRNALHGLLAAHGHAALFPAEFRTRPRFAEGQLAYWLSHPNELQQCPDEIALAEVVTLPSDAPGTPGTPALDYYLFRFRTSPPNFAADRGWMAGVCGPFPHGSTTPPAPSAAGAFDDAPPAFSELTPFDAKPPIDHVREAHATFTARGMLPAWAKPSTPTRAAAAPAT